MCILCAFGFTCVYMSACARLYMHTCVHGCTGYMCTVIRVHICTHACVHACSHTAHTCLCMQASVHECTVYTCTCMYVHTMCMGVPCACSCTCMTCTHACIRALCMFTHMHTMLGHTRMCTCAHTCVQIHTCAHLCMCVCVLCACACVCTHNCSLHFALLEGGAESAPHPLPPKGSPSQCLSRHVPMNPLRSQRQLCSLLESTPRTGRGLSQVQGKEGWGTT